MKGPVLKILLVEILFVLSLFYPDMVPAEESHISLTEAVRKTLEKNPGVKAEQMKVDREKGLVQKAAGVFDWYAIGNASRTENRDPMTLAQKAALFGALDQIAETEDVYSAGLTKKLRSGVSVTPLVSTVDYENNTDFPDPVDSSEVSLEIVIPLMRGLGTENAAAEELAAKSNLKAAEYLYKYNVEARIFQTVSSFWNTLAALENLSILRDSADRTRRINEFIERYVRGGELEPALMRQARGKLYARQVELKSGELTLTKSRYSLAVATGLEPQEVPDSPLPAGSLPEVMDPDRLKHDLSKRYITEALARRGDFLSARARVETAEILLQKAENGLKPELDLSLRAGYKGLDESDDTSRFTKSFSNNLTDLNVFAGLSLKLPIRNNLAKGDYASRRASLEEIRLQAAELGNNIGSEVMSALETFRNSIHQYTLARQSVENYEKAVEHENRKLKAGESNLTDLIDMEDRYFEARTIENNALKAYAVALAELRFVTGTLTASGDGDLRFKLDNLFELP